MAAPPSLDTHLERWLGAPMPPSGVTVVGSARRSEPAWDGKLQPFFGVVAPEAAVLSVPLEAVGPVRASVAGREPGELEAAGPAIVEALGRARGRLGAGVYRCSVNPSPLDDAGVWVPVGDPAVPAWLIPFGGEVLLALDGGGRYVAGVGIKRHDPTGAELAVVTEEAARGRGLARRLVAQAARRVVAGGAVAVYLHAPDNVASARVAEAAGFPDLGWRCLGLWG